MHPANHIDVCYAITQGFEMKEPNEHDGDIVTPLQNL